MPELTYSDQELGLEPGWDTDEQGQPLGKHIREALRSSRIIQKQAAEARAEAEAAKRELAFYRAGVPQDARGQFFARAYDGPDDAESVKAAFEALWPTGNGGTNSNEGSDGTETAQRIAEAGSAGTPGGGSTVDFADALRAARGDNAKIRELIANAPPEARIKLPDVY
jgi:hypothetical protein